MQKRKILYVITKGNWGGAQRYVFDLATHLPKEEFDVVVALGEGGLFVEKLAAHGVRVIPIPVLQRDISLLKEVRSLLALYRAFKEERPDIVHLNSSKAAFLGALAARLYQLVTLNFKLVTIFTVHGWPFNEERGRFWKSGVWLASYLTALFSHRVIVVSEYDGRLARRMPFVGRKTVRIHNGIAPMVFGSGERIRSAFPRGVRITGTVGELTRNKSQETLIEAARKDPHLYVAIVGEGEMRERLEALIETYRLRERVKLFGFIPSSEVLRGFDVFALPSRKEGFPYALLEAKSAGLPLSANRIGGVGEILDNKNPEEFTLARMVAQTLALYRATR